MANETWWSRLWGAFRSKATPASPPTQVEQNVQEILKTQYPPSAVEALAAAPAQRPLSPAPPVNFEIKYRPAHPDRLGGTIHPRGIVVHTTDCMPGSEMAIIQRWTSEAGAGNCAHFLIGRTKEIGITQFAHINCNANHAGGKSHGWYAPMPGQAIGSTYESTYHPNLVTVGIELSNAGRLQKVNGKYIHPDTRRELPASDVYESDGAPWHMPTEWQMQALEWLIGKIELQMHAETMWPLPFDPTVTRVEPNGGYLANGVPWAKMPGVFAVGHVTLDPTNKTDPGPYVIRWLKERH